VSTTPAYDERLGVPFRWWVQGTMLVATLWLAVVVAVPGAVAWVVTAIALALLGVGLWTYGNARLRVDGDTFRAGRAHIHGRFLGATTVLDEGEARWTAGPGADARAFLVLRPYLKRAVKVEITDPADPAPYWLVATRHPQELAAALAALRESVRH
jgi:DUF3093 family protein